MPNSYPELEAQRFGERLIALLERHGQSRRGAGAYLARRYKVSNVTANAWLNGIHKPEADLVRLIAHDHNDSFEALYFGARSTRASAAKSAAHDDPGPALVWVNKIEGARLSAGNGEVIYDLEERQNSHGFREEYMQRRGLKATQCKLWTVKGDSMEPRYSSGDVVLLDMSDREPRHGKVFAIVDNNELRIKQLIKDAAGWTMRSFNPDKVRFPDEPITNDGFAIIGRVRWRGGDED